LGGWNYQMDSFVWALKAIGPLAAPLQPMTIRPLTPTQLQQHSQPCARAGLPLDNTLLYVTGGLAAVDMEFGAVMPDLIAYSDSQWVYGWTVGGGLEHAFSQNFSGRIEYLYVNLDDSDYSMTDTGLVTFDATQSFEDIHMVRAGLTYNFGW
jgi:outer membrane immunogenic protein